MPKPGLTQTQALLYRYFSDHRGRVISRDELAEAVWRQPYRGTTRTIDQNVAMLRKKLTSLDGRLVSVRSVGYRLENGPTRRAR